MYNHDILTSAIASAMSPGFPFKYSLMYFGGGSRDRDESSGLIGAIGVVLTAVLAPIGAATAAGYFAYA